MRAENGENCPLNLGGGVKLIKTKFYATAKWVTLWCNSNPRTLCAAQILRE